MSANYTLKDLPPEERPRERLKEIGVENLSLQELLALVIGRGTKNKNVLQLAQELLSHFGNLQNIRRASLEELQQIQGIGPATATKLQAVFQLGQKAQQNHKKYGEKLTQPNNVFQLLKNKLKDKKKEHFLLLCLDNRNQLISIDQISVGSLGASIAHPREVFKIAIRHSAAQVIIVHNHPSGDVSPSNADIKITQKLLDASKLIGIKLMDHVIISSEGYYSFIKEE